MDEDNDEQLSDSNVPFGGKAFKPTKQNFRKNAVIRRKNASANAKHQHQLQLQKQNKGGGDRGTEDAFYRREAQKILKKPKVLAALIRGRERWGIGGDAAQGVAVGNNAANNPFTDSSCSAALLTKEIKPLEVYLLPNASYHRVFSSIRQSQLNHEFLKKFTTDAELDEEDEEIGRPSAASHSLAPALASIKNCGASSANAIVGGGAALSSSMEQMLIDEEFRHSSMIHKTIPKVVFLGLNVVLDIIKDSYAVNPSICIRSLRSLQDLLTGLKPESLKCEPSGMIEKFFELLLSLISMSYSSMGNRCNISSSSSYSSSHYYDQNFHRQVLELSISCLITLSIARGDTAKILSCIKTLLIDCNFNTKNDQEKSLHSSAAEANSSNNNNNNDDTFNSSQSTQSTFNIEVPEIMVLLKKNVCSFLLGRVNIPEWCSIGFPVNALCETFSVYYWYQKRSGKLPYLLETTKTAENKYCATSFAFDGELLVLYRCRYLHRIGSGYNGTPIGQEMLSTELSAELFSGKVNASQDFSSRKSANQAMSSCCCSPTCWIGFINGDLYLQPYCWSRNTLLCLDSTTLTPIATIPVISDYTSTSESFDYHLGGMKRQKSPLQSATLATTDGEYLVLMSAAGGGGEGTLGGDWTSSSSSGDDYFLIRELKPHKVVIETTTGKHLPVLAEGASAVNSSSSNQKKKQERVTFLLSSELTVRLSTVSMLFAGSSIHGAMLHLPAKSRGCSSGSARSFANCGHLSEKTTVANEASSYHVSTSFNASKSFFLSLTMKQLDTNNLVEYKSVANIVTGKDFALMLTEQGKVYYSGNAQSLGIRHIYSVGKWFMLSIPKPVRITQIAAGHEGHHALLLSEDGTLFFVGSARRGEDGDLSVRQGGCSHRFNKPSRVKKFSCRLEAASTPAFIAANHGSSAVVTKTGELYIFGKDSYHCNSKGLVNLMAMEELRVKSIVLGKAHMLILTVGGMVITAGFSNKGQCGLGQTTTTTAVVGQQQSGHQQACLNELTSLDDMAPPPCVPQPHSLQQNGSNSAQKKYSNPTFIQYHGHMFIFGKARVCRKCSKCTEFGAKCSYLRIASTSDSAVLNETDKDRTVLKQDSSDQKSETAVGGLCGCGEGNSGCIYCGICAACSKDVPICRRLKGSCGDPEEPLAIALPPKSNPNFILSREQQTKEAAIDCVVGQIRAESADDSAETQPSRGSFDHHFHRSRVTATDNSKHLAKNSNTSNTSAFSVSERGGITTTTSSVVIASETESDSASIRIVAPTILPLSTTQAIVQIAAGLHHSVLLTDVGEVYTFGSNQFGQLGTGDFSNRYTPTKLGTALVTRGVIRQIAAGSNHTVLLSSLGEVITFGNNQQGQLGRLPYNSCKLERYAWSAFPGKMENVGPAFGRIATWISATGDFTYVKYDEMLLSANLLTSTKLVADRNSLILIPPERLTSHSQSSSSKNEVFDRLFEEKSCKHHYCATVDNSGGKGDRKESESTTTVTTAPIFNNLYPNLLIISRINGTCSMLSPATAAKALAKQLGSGSNGSNGSSAPFDVTNQLNFDAYSSVLLDRYYHNFWTYNAQLDEFARFNLIELEAASKMAKLYEDVVHRQQLQQQQSTLVASSSSAQMGKQQQASSAQVDLLMMKFPNSLFNLNQLNTMAITATVFMQNVPSALLADITVPLIDYYCTPRQTPQQLGIELLSFLTSLTYSHLLGISVNDKLEQLNILTHSMPAEMPTEYASLCRFEDYGGGWGYPPRSVEAIRFCSDSDIILGGVGLYGGRGEYTVQLRLFDIGFDGGDLEREGDLLSETDIVHYECLPRQKYQILFDDPVFITANRWYIIWAAVSGPSSDCGSAGQPFVCTADQVMFHFKPSKLSNNGTDVNSGQIPVLYYKPIKVGGVGGVGGHGWSGEHLQSLGGGVFQGLLSGCNTTNLSLLSLDDEGLPFYISKDFALKINSTCIFSLCDLLQHVWDGLKALLHTDRLIEVFSETDDCDLDEKLSSLIAEIKRQLYIACFVLELIRAYVALVVPHNEIDSFGNGITTAHLCPYQQSQKSSHPTVSAHINAARLALKQNPNDPEEQLRTARAFVAISSMLTAILSNPIEISVPGVLGQFTAQQTKHSQIKDTHIVQQKFSALFRLNNFFIDECHQTFLACTYAFYPSGALKWSSLCSLLLSDTFMFENCESEGISVDQQVCCESSGSLFSNRQLYLLSAVIKAFCAGNLLLVSFFPTFQSVVSESSYDDTKESPGSDLSGPYNTEHYLCHDHSSQVIFDSLLAILVKPIRHAIECGQHARKRYGSRDCLSENNNQQQPLPPQMAPDISGDYRQFANNSAASDASNVAYEVPSLNLSVEGDNSSSGGDSSSSSSSSSTSGRSSRSPSSLLDPQSGVDSSSTPDDDQAVATTSKGCADNSAELMQEDAVDFSFHSANDNSLTRVGKDAKEDSPGDDGSLENLPANKCHQIYRVVDSKKAYSRKLVAGACELMVKFVVELSACSVGLISSPESSSSGNIVNGQSKANLYDLQQPFGNSQLGGITTLSSPEYVTPSRFCRRSSTKSWDTGSGSPEAICFSVNKSSIYISGVRVYAFSMGQLKYQLLLYEQMADVPAAADDNRVNGVVGKNGGNSGSSYSAWRPMASVSGMLAVDDNQSSDFCELRFDRPVLISANVKYAIIFKNFSIASFSGDMGLPQVRGDDETLFTFMDCSLSKNGTNLSRGQIPQILYYNYESTGAGTSDHKQHHHHHYHHQTHQQNYEKIRGLTRQTLNSQVAYSISVSMFKATIGKAKELIQATNDLVAEYTGQKQSSNGDTGAGKRSKNYIRNDTHFLELLHSLFESVLFRDFIPTHIFYLYHVLNDLQLCYEVLLLLSSILPLVSELNKSINAYFSSLPQIAAAAAASSASFSASKPSTSTTTSNYYLIVESDHPYKAATVTSYLVRFPPTVQWMALEFDPKSQTAQDEDYLEIYIPKESFKHFCSRSPPITYFEGDQSDNGGSSFRHLTGIYKRFSGRNFTPMMGYTYQTYGLYSFNTLVSRLPSGAFFVPGNELVLMLKTSSDYVHATDHDAAYYGFKAQVIGYEQHYYHSTMHFSTGNNSDENDEEEENETSLTSNEEVEGGSRSSKEALFQRAKALIGRFEGDLVYLFGLCVSTLLSSSSTNTIANLANRLAATVPDSAQKTRSSTVKHQESERAEAVAWQPKLHPDDCTEMDIEIAEEIYAENESILRKGLSFEVGSHLPLTIASLLDFNLPNAAVNAFLDDFIRLKPESSGSRLALWFQSESFLSPGCCLVSTLTSVDFNFCCLQCAAYLEGNFLESSNSQRQQGSQLCPRCHYQLFVKTIPPLPQQKQAVVVAENMAATGAYPTFCTTTAEPPVYVGQRLYIKVVTRDQHEEIAYDPNACVAINIRLVSPFETVTENMAKEEERLAKEDGAASVSTTHATARNNQKPQLGSQKGFYHQQKFMTANQLLLELIIANPYQITVKDKCRFHAISMMKPYEGYSFEELRYETYVSAVGKQNGNGGRNCDDNKLTCESVSVKSFDNGYYLASWTPNSPGSYRVELVVDGESAPEAATMLTVSDDLEAFGDGEDGEELDAEALEELDRYRENIDLSVRADPFFQINIPYGKEREVLEKIKSKEKLGFYSGDLAVDLLGTLSNSSKSPKISKLRHRIRKFICHDSAGLRIRALPSLQSEQIGIVAVNGLLTIVDQYENDDGTWVRLSNESIQAYCSGGAGGNGGSSSSISNNSNANDSKESNNSHHPHHHSLHHHHHHHPFQTPPDNSSTFESSPFKKSSVEPKNLKQSLTFTTMRTEAWTLQYNRHFNRTLLVPIDAEAEAVDAAAAAMKPTKVKLGSLKKYPKMKICPIRTHYNHNNSMQEQHLYLLNNANHHHSNYHQQQQKKKQQLVVKQKFKKKIHIPGWFQVVNCGPDGALIRNSPNLLEVSVIIGLIKPNEIINGVQMVYNEFGSWIRLSQDCLVVHCGELMDSRQSSFFAATASGSDFVDAWMLAEGVNGVEYLRYAPHMHVPEDGEEEDEEEGEEDADDDEPNYFRENPGAYGIPVQTNSRYSLSSGAASAADHHHLEAIDNCCTTAPSKRAISNSAAQCIRAIFAAFVWHEGVLHDVLTAASYLKFNAEITKDIIKGGEQSTRTGSRNETRGSPKRRNGNAKARDEGDQGGNSGKRGANRSQKALFRHSVEVSQLLSCWTSSDVNSNMNEALNSDQLQLQHHHHHHHHRHNHLFSSAGKEAISAEALAEANNNNNTLNNNGEELPPPDEPVAFLMENNPVSNAAAPATVLVDTTGVSTPQDDLIQIPEILINLLKIWDFVSSESMKVFTTFNAQKRRLADDGNGEFSRKDVEEMFIANEAAGNAADLHCEGAAAEACENCGSRLQLIQELIPFGINIDASNAFRNCECMKDRLNKAAVAKQQQDQGKDSNFFQINLPKEMGGHKDGGDLPLHLRSSSRWQQKHDSHKYASIANIKQLYGALSAGCFYLLSAVPANAPSLTGTFRLANNRNSSFENRNYVFSASSGGDENSSSNPLTQLTIDNFTVDESSLVFQSLHHLGIQKSVYEQRLAEEKLSDLAILSLQQEEEAEDYQQLLLSPESVVGESSGQHKTNNLEAKKSNFKFYRSISVGMNDSPSNEDQHGHQYHNHLHHHPHQQYHHRRKSPYRQYMQQYNTSATASTGKSGNQIGKSSETLDSTLSDDVQQISKFNMPFLCKPSSRLISLIQECMNGGASAEGQTLGSSTLSAVRSPLFRRDVFRFIFSCYNIDLFSLVQRGTVCAAGYRTLGLHAVNWLLVNVSTTASVHDAFWIFVSSLLPKEMPVSYGQIDLGEGNAQEAGADQGEEAAEAEGGGGAAAESPAKKRQKKEPKVEGGGERKRPPSVVDIRSAAAVVDQAGPSTASRAVFSDVCRHPFDNLDMAGESAEGWVTDGLQHFIRSVAKLLPLLPAGSSLQQMAIRCLGVDFKPRDHIFLHECKVFSHISTILTRSSASSVPNATDADREEKSSQNSEEDENHPLVNHCLPFTLLDLSVDATSRFELTTSSRSSMIPSLLDNSTETFWESGNEDRTRVKYFSLTKSKDETMNNPQDTSHIKFIAIYIDNGRDSEYRVRQVDVKLMMEKADAIKHCALSDGDGSGGDAYATNLSLFTGASEIEFAKVVTVQVDPKFCGWLTVELTLAQSREIISSFKYLRIELTGPYQGIRVRQLKVLSVANFAETLSSLLSGRQQQHYAAEHRRVISLADSLQVVAANCEGETLRVFRLLSSQVFGKLLSSDSTTNSSDSGTSEKRSSVYLGQGTSGNSNSGASGGGGETDLREHMVGILFSQSGKLSELQKQVCSHIVHEIHLESAKVREEWEQCFTDEEQGIEAYLGGQQQSSSGHRRKLSASSSRHQDHRHFFEKSISVSNNGDAYCFELLSLVQALSGSVVGCDYLARQNELFYDILTLLHTGSDRVKRQVLSLIRRVIGHIKPTTFTRLVGLTELPNLGDIFARTHKSLSSTSSSRLQEAQTLEAVEAEKGREEDVDEIKSVLYHFGPLDIFLAGIAKSLAVTTKIKGSGSRCQVMHCSASIFRATANHYRQWWLKGSMNRSMSHSVIGLLKEMLAGVYGTDWAAVARVSLIEKILNLTHLSESNRTVPDRCINTPTLWLALAALCVLDEGDAEMLSTSALSKYHDQANGNSSQMFCDNHDDGETIALVQCAQCGNLCADCDRFLHLNTRTKSHKRHILKEKFDSIKVDIHEGCSRAKFCWALAVADSNLLKAMVEFRVGSMLKTKSVDSTGGGFVTTNSGTLALLSSLHQQCRFCGAEDASAAAMTSNSVSGGGDLGYVCSNEDCQRFRAESCTKVLSCGHFCHGVLGEDVCLPCLHGCANNSNINGDGNLRQDGDDMCMVCFSESLFAGPCIQLTCRHVFHAHCIRTALEKRWSGGRISFNFARCPICKVAIDHPSLATLLAPITSLLEDVRRKALMRLEYEGLHRCKAITEPGGRFYGDAAGFAMDKYSYYLCFKCEKAYFGGEARCDAELLDGDAEHFNPEELICGSCSDVAQAQICPKHGTDFLEYKCRFCCSVAVYFCFGSTHFCNACHEDFQRLVVLKDYPQCPVGPRCVPLEGERECPLHVLHPPTGEEFALGCGICRNAHTF